MMPRLVVVPIKDDRSADLSSSFAVADIRRLAPAHDETQSLLNVVLPINGRAEGDEMVLEPGSYLFRVRMPSGETLIETLQVDATWPRSTVLVVADELGFRRREKRRTSDSLNAASSSNYSLIEADTLDREVTAQPPGQKKQWLWSKHVLSTPMPSWLSDTDGFRTLISDLGDNAAPYVLHRLKVKPIESPLVALRDERASPGDIAMSLFGQALAIQPTKVAATSSGFSLSQWKVAEKGKVDPAEQARYYGVLVANTGDGSMVQKVASIPDRWIGLDGTKDDFFRAEIVEHPDFSSGARIRLSVTDPRAMSLMSFLQTGDLDAALAVSRPARGFVRQGAQNAYAAVAAAYALVYAPAGAGNPGWEEWVLELARNRSDIPDGKILEATLLLQREVPRVFFAGAEFPPAVVERRLERAWGCVQEAVRRGPPVFRLGLRLLEENIRILRDSGADVVDHSAAVAAANVTGWLRARVDPYQPLCVFDVS